MRIVLISIKPKYVKSIISGKKTVELRRRIPKIKKGDLVFIYSTSPVKAIQAYSFVDKIVSKEPEELWNEVESISGVSKKEFDNYYKGKFIGYGIYLKDIEPIIKPISLDDLREKFEISNPPQSFRYLSKSQFVKTTDYIVPLQLSFKFYKQDFIRRGLDKIVKNYQLQY